MKKVFMMALAAAAITLSSCGNKTNGPNESEIVDSTEVALNEANTAADEVIAQLTQNIDAKDASALQNALEAVKAKVSEFLTKNPEIAKEYLAKVQNFLKENTDKIKAVVGTGTIASLVDAVNNLPAIEVPDVAGAAADAVEGAADAAQDAAQGAVDAAQDAAQGAADAVQGAADAAQDAAQGAVDAAKGAAADAVQGAADKVKGALQ